MKVDAKRAREMYDNAERDSASLVESKIASAAVGNGVMPRRYLFTSCNKVAARAMKDAGFSVYRIGPYALVRW